MRVVLIVVLVLVFPFAALAIDYQGNCSIAFHASSTLHDFDGTGRCQPFSVNAQAGVMTIPELSVAIDGLDTDNAKRDKKMREMFDSEHYPLILGRTGPVAVGAIRSALSGGNDGTAEVPFRLKIRDIEKSVTAAVQNVVETDSGISADLVFSLSLADYHLKPPTVLGFIGVDDTVKVTTSFSLDAR